MFTVGTNTRPIGGLRSLRAPCLRLTVAVPAVGDARYIRPLIGIMAWTLANAGDARALRGGWRIRRRRIPSFQAPASPESVRGQNAFSLLSPERDSKCRASNDGNRWNVRVGQKSGVRVGRFDRTLHSNAVVVAATAYFSWTCLWIFS